MSSYDTPSFHWPRPTPAIRLLLIVNAAVFVANMLVVGRLSAPGNDGGGFWFAFSWPALWEGYGLGLVRIVTYQFTHSFHSLGHLVMNMLVLYFFGTSSEARLGYRGTLKLYLVGGAVGAFVHLALAALQGEAAVPLVGASGACYGFLVYAACRSPHSIVYLIVFPIPLWVLAGGLCLFGAYDTYIEMVTGYSSGVAHGAHLGGAALGFLAFRRSWFIDWQDHADVARPGLFRGLLRGLQQRRTQVRQQRAHEQQQALDEVLAKVKQGGLSSLTPAERKFLERMSREAQKRG